MRRYWPIIFAGALLLLVLNMSPVDGAQVIIDLEEDEFSISVDPSDDNRGVLEIKGTINGNLPNIRDQLTVILTANITEEHDGEPTGRYWACTPEFDGETVSPEEIRLTFNQDSADFTIYIAPEEADGLNGDIPVPGQLSPLTVGKLIIKIEYTGSDSGQDTETATITPDYYHLINLSTGTNPWDVKAGNMLTYNLRIINAGNEIDTVNVEIPIWDELIEDGWRINLSHDRFLDMEPGLEERSVLDLVAPDEILEDEDIEIIVIAYTDEMDPDDEEVPASLAEFIIELDLKKSKVSDPIITDDDDDDDDDDEITPDQQNSPAAMIAITAVMATLAIIVVIVLFVNRGGGGDDEGGDNDMHTSMIRI